MGKIPSNIDRLSDKDLLKLRILVGQELHRRGLKFSVGELGENYAIEHFNSTPGLPNLLKAPTGAKNVDALSRDGDRYSIKTVQRGKKTGTIYPDSEENDKQLFEFILLAVLDDQYELDQLFRFSWKDFLKVRAWDKRMNAWYIPVSKNRIKTAQRIK
ncbi:hypothetical protein [Ekhidna sp.]|uniref:hypothetical protein n=1 Tax=Ekhidna sp. TaxID=2608089 RepID=UPI003CCC1BFA